MSSGAWLSIVFVALALILPISALRQRRIAPAKLLTMALVWGAIFVAVTLVVGFFL